MAYLGDTYPPKEFAKKQPILGTYMLFGGSGGGLLGGVVISATGRLVKADGHQYHPPLTAHTNECNTLPS